MDCFLSFLTFWMPHFSVRHKVLERKEGRGLMGVHCCDENNRFLKDFYVEEFYGINFVDIN